MYKKILIATDGSELADKGVEQGVALAKEAGRYTGRQADTATHERIIALRTAGHSIPDTARLAGCSESQVKRVWSMRATASPA